VAKRKEPADKEVADKKQPAAVIAPVKAATAAPNPQRQPAKKGKLLPKHKSRLPRKLKKARKKAAGPSVRKRRQVG
jgi:hypothetical protein